MTEKEAGTKIWCPFYRGVRLIWVSVLRGSTVFRILEHLETIFAIMTFILYVTQLCVLTCKLC